MADKPTKTRSDVPMTQIIAELQAGKTAKQIADSCGTTTQAIYSRCARAGFSVVAVRSYMARKADLFAWKQQQIIEGMTPDKIQAASLRDQATAFNVLLNAERLERGQSTSNVSFADMSRELDELDAEEARLRNLLLEKPVAKSKPPTVALVGGDSDEGTD
jgi:hypothetical protein